MTAKIFINSGNITINFIVKLPVSKESEIDQSYNFIFVATNRLTKYGYFILYRKDMSAKNLAYLFNRHIIS
jgi:hypothetical protein